MEDLGERQAQVSPCGADESVQKPVAKRIGAALEQRARSRGYVAGPYPVLLLARVMGQRITQRHGHPLQTKAGELWDEQEPHCVLPLASP